MAAEDDEIVDFSFDDVVAQLDDSEENSEKIDSRATDEEVTLKNVDLESSVEEVKEKEGNFVEPAIVNEKNEEGSEIIEDESVKVDSQKNQVMDESPKDEVEEVFNNFEDKSDLILDEENNAEVRFDDIAEQVDSLIQDEEIVETFTEGKDVEVEISDLDLLEKKKDLIEVMQKENELLDEILKTQTDLHNLVKEKNWDGLNEKLEGLQILSDNFAELDEEREKLCELIDIRTDEDVSPVLLQVRGKLQKSKIENHVLNEYISTTRKFLQGVFDSVVPQRRNVLYSKNGKIVRPELSGVAVNISL